MLSPLTGGIPLKSHGHQECCTICNRCLRLVRVKIQFHEWTEKQKFIEATAIYRRIVTSDRCYCNVPWCCRVPDDTDHDSVERGPCFFTDVSSFVGSVSSLTSSVTCIDVASLRIVRHGATWPYALAPYFFFKSKCASTLRRLLAASDWSPLPTTFAAECLSRIANRGSRIADSVFAQPRIWFNRVVVGVVSHVQCERS